MKTSQSYVWDSPVPFSPIPGHPVEMSFEPGGWTRSDTPLMEMARKRFRSASIYLALDDRDARDLAQDGIDFESAYMARMQAEVKAGVR